MPSQFASMKRSNREGAIDASMGRRVLFLLAVSSGTLLNPLNSSIISLALHPIQHAFRLPFTTVSWVISSFYIASAVGQPIMGKLGDEIGRKRVFLSGLTLAMIASIAAPFVSLFALLLLFRVLQAVGTSAIYPSGMGLVRKHIQQKQAFALSIVSIFSSVTVALGPTIGSFAIAAGGWPAIFTINLPFLLVSFLLAYTIFPADEPRAGGSLSRLLQKLDLPGIFLFTTALLCLLSFLLSLRFHIQYIAGIGGVLALLHFLRHELRTEEPFINVRMFQKHPIFTRVNVLFIMLNIYNYALLFGLPTYFQDEMGLSMETVGLLMLFLSGFGIVISPLTGKWVDKAGVRLPLLLGSICMIAGAALLTAVFTLISWQWVIPVLSLMGIGYGLQNVSLQTALLQAAPPEDLGVATGLFQTSRYLGAIVSSALLGFLFGKDITAFQMQLLGGLLLLLACFSLLLGSRFKSTPIPNICRDKDGIL